MHRLPDIDVHIAFQSIMPGLGYIGPDIIGQEAHGILGKDAADLIVIMQQEQAYVKIEDAAAFSDPQIGGITLLILQIAVYPEIGIQRPEIVEVNGLVIL